MNLSEQQIFKGYWWLPEKPEDKVAGVLTYSPGESILLELIGCFRGSEDSELGFITENNDLSVIHGVDSGAKEISLLDCGGSFSYNFSSEFPIMHYHARYMVYDKHVLSMDDRCDYTAYVKFDELTLWALPSVFTYIFEQDPATHRFRSCTIKTMEYNAESVLIQSVLCENGVTLSLNRDCTVIPGEYLLKPFLEQWTYLEIKKQDGILSIREIYHEIEKFEDFLSLATKREILHKQIYLHDPEIGQNDEKGNRFPSSIYLLDIQRKRQSLKKIDRRRFLFRYEDIQSHFSKILPRWMSDTDNLQPIKSHLVESLIYKPVVSSVDFLQVIQAVEGVWWRFREDSYRANHKVKAMQTPLTVILSEFLTELKDIQTIADLKLDIQAVVDSRHYYSHFVDKSRKPKTLDGLALYELTKKLRMILLCLVLDFLGLSHKEIEDILKKNLDWGNL